MFKIDFLQKVNECASAEIFFFFLQIEGKYWALAWGGQNFLLTLRKGLWLFYSCIMSKNCIIILKILITKY